MRTSDLSVHSDGEVQPLKKWFQDTYSRDYLAHPQQTFELASMSVHSPFKSFKHTPHSATPHRRFRATSLSPRYLSPIASGSKRALEEEFVMGCSVCGTKAIEGVAWTHHGSPPRLRPSNRPELVDMDQENSGAYSEILSCRLHRAYSYLSEAVNMKELRLLEGKLDAENSPFAVQVETNGAGAQTTVVKEVFPAPTVPLTPLNYEESSLLKDSFFHNSVAQKYVKEEERQRVAIRRAEYSNRVKGFTRIVETTRLKSGEVEALGEPVYTTSSLEVVQVPMDTASSAEERKEEAVRAISTGEFEVVSGEELRELQMDERKREFAVKAPSAFRTPQRHNTAAVRSEREPAPPRSPAAESEEMTESTGQVPSSELARKKLEEIKKTVKQRQDERKGQNGKQSSLVSGQKGSFSGRNSRRHPTGGSTKEAATPHDSEPIPGRPKSNSTAGPASNTTLVQSSEVIRTREERKSAVVGAVRLKVEDPADPVQDSSEEEGLVPPQPMAAEAMPGLGDSEGSMTSEDYQESISPIPPIETYAGVGGTMESFPGLPTEEGRDDTTEEGKRGELTECGKSVFEDYKKLPTGKSPLLKPTASLGTPHPVPESAPEEEVTPVPCRSNPAPTFQAAAKPPSKLASPREVPGATVSDYTEQGKKDTLTDMTRGKGKPASSGSPLHREVSGEGTSSQVSQSQVKGVKGKSAQGTPERSPNLTPRPATERGANLAFLGHTGATIHTGQSHFRDSRPAPSLPATLPLGRNTEIPSKTAKSTLTNAGKTMPQSAPRQKLSSTRTSKVSSFHRLQEEAAILIQRAARRFLVRSSRNKACQSSAQQYTRLQAVLELLEDSDVLAGLRMLGGFVEYLEERGLREM